METIFYYLLLLYCDTCTCFNTRRLLDATGTDEVVVHLILEPTCPTHELNNQYVTLKKIIGIYRASSFNQFHQSDMVINHTIIVSKKTI